MFHRKSPKASTSQPAVLLPTLGLQKLLHWFGAIAAVAGLGVVAASVSGATVSAPEQCRRSVSASGYYREAIEWDAPASIREAISVQNYERKRAFLRLLKSCDRISGSPTIICGPLKCGGLFSSETESTEQRLARELSARAADRAEVAVRRRIEDQARLERILRDDQEDVIKKLQRRQ